MINQNGQRISLVPTIVVGQVADASAADIDFGIEGPAFLLPAADGTLKFKDSNGNTISVVVKENEFFQAMASGVNASGSDAIAYSYWR